MKRIIALLLAGLELAAFCAAQTQQNTGSDFFRQEGIASWYGIEFDGLPTASGEIFNASLFTAAHPSLPFGTQLKITNKHNNKQVVVRVNDRGPFVSARIIDLSRAAAEQLDMIATGTAPVIVETISIPVVSTEPDSPAQDISPNQPETIPAVPVDPLAYISAAPEIAREPLPREPALQPQPAKAAALPPAKIKGGVPVQGSGKIYRLQVGAYKVERNAVDVFDRLKGGGLHPAYERNGEFYRVVLAGIKAEDVSSVVEKLGAAGFQEVFIREEER
jgi:rare lipoprotein A